MESFIWSIINDETEMFEMVLESVNIVFAVKLMRETMITHDYYF